MPKLTAIATLQSEASLSPPAEVAIEYISRIFSSKGTHGGQDKSIAFALCLGQSVVCGNMVNTKSTSSANRC